MRLIKLGTSLEEKIPIQLHLGCGFFVGMSFLLSAWSLQESVYGMADIALYTTVLIMLVIIFVSSSFKKELSIIKNLIDNNKYSISILLIIFSFTIFCYNLPPTNFSLWERFGTPLGIRYANVAIYISQTNTIPAISQNSGQSILAAIPLFFGLKNTALLNLYLWLIPTISALALLIFGFFRYLEIPFTKSCLGLFIVMCGNATLSLIHTHVIDSHSPILANGYSHDLFSAGSFFSMLLLIRWIFLHKIKSLSSLIIIFSSLIVSWCLTAPQNIIIGIPLLLILGIISLKKNNLNKKIFFILILGTVFCIGIGTTQGGFLSILKKHDNVEIPGLTDSPIKKLYLVNPGLKYSNIFIDQGLQYPDPNRLHKNINFYKRILEKDKYGNYSLKSGSEIFSRFIEFWVIFEVELWLALRIMFFPILGIFCLNIFISPSFIKYKLFEIPTNKLSILNYFSFVTTLTFLGGFIIAFFFYLDGQKWPLSRFFLPGYTLSIISFFIVLKLFLDKGLTIGSGSKKIWFIIIFLTTIGPSSNIILTGTRNILSVSPEGMNFLERSQLLLKMDKMIKE